MTAEDYMAIALEDARKAAARDEVPVGAVLVERESGTVIARNGNRTRAYNDPTAHAEILVIREGCEKAGTQRIPECDLYVTLEPCALCAAAISFARIGTLYYGASDPKGGGVEHGPRFFSQPTCHHRPAVKSGLHAAACGQILKEFFRSKRQKNDG